MRINWCARVFILTASLGGPVASCMCRCRHYPISIWAILLSLEMSICHFRLVIPWPIEPLKKKKKNGLQFVTSATTINIVRNIGIQIHNHDRPRDDSGASLINPSWIETERICLQWETTIYSDRCHLHPNSQPQSTERQFESGNIKSRWLVMPFGKCQCVLCHSQWMRLLHMP